MKILLILGSSLLILALLIIFFVDGSAIVAGFAGEEKNYCMEREECTAVLDAMCQCPAYPVNKKEAGVAKLVSKTVHNIFYSSMVCGVCIVPSRYACKDNKCEPLYE